MNTEVYRNLTNKLISVRQNGLVVCHAEYVTLVNPYFKVRESGRQLVLKTKEKNVHAFVCGDLVNIGNYNSYKQRDPVITHKDHTVIENGVIVKYNPYKYPHFFINEGDQIQEQFKYVTVYANGKILAI
jgi:hypothetical protein